MKLLETLITKQWFWLKGTIVTDKGFTTFRGLQWLADRGIAGVGMCKTKGRPKKLPHGAASHWPLRGTDEKLDSEVREPPVPSSRLRSGSGYM